MTYSQYLTDFFSGLSSVMNWIRTRLFPVTANGRALYNHPLVFTIMGIGLILLIIEELIGLISSFRFGGFIFRHFRPWFLRGYQVSDTFPDYSKESRIKPFRPFYRPFYRAKYTGKYFINYNGRYYPVSCPRYNPFAISRFNSEFKAGNIISYSQLYNSNLNPSYTTNNIKGIAKNGYNDLSKLGNKYFKPKIDDFSDIVSGEASYGLEDTDFFEGLSDSMGSSLASDVPEPSYTLNGYPAIKNENGSLSYDWDKIED